jgi:translation initiation factor IF-3
MLSRQFVIMDYKKFVYEQRNVIKSKSKIYTSSVKEIRFGPQTDEHDYEFKRKNAEKFLKEGAKLKALFL